MNLAVLALSAAALLPVQGPDREPEVLCRLARDTVFAGESVLYEVELRNIENPVAPVLEGLGSFRVEPAGERSMNTSQTLIVNGETTELQYFGRIYSYQLTPTRTGEFMIPAPKVALEDRVLSGQPLTLVVQEPTAQGLVELIVSLDRAKVYPMQPFTVRLEVLVRQLPDSSKRAHQDPLTPVLRSPPQLQIPWHPAPENLETGDLNSWLGHMMAQNGVGFGINGLTRRGAVFERQAVFMPPAQWVQKSAPNGSPISYRRYLIDRVFQARKEGEYEFGPVTCKGIIVSDFEGGRFLVEDVFASSNTVTLEVAPAPAAGRPPGFTGAIGTFTASATMDPVQAQTGDPMTLTLTVRGRGTLEHIRAPDLTQVPAVAEAFKVYEAMAEPGANGRTRSFTYRLRPIKAGIESFPSIPIDYFDPESESYEVLRTNPISIHVREAERVTDDSILSGGERPERRIESAMMGYAPNDVEVNRMVDRVMTPPALATWIGAMLVAWGVAAGVTTIRRRRALDEAGTRRRGARSKARERMDSALAVLRSGDQEEGAAAITEALSGIFADAMDRPAAGLTALEVKALAEELGCSRELSGRVWVLLEDCDSVRFGSGGPSPDELAREAESIMDEAVRVLKKEGRLR